LRAALISQFGESARGAIDAELSTWLSSSRDQKLSREEIETIERRVLAALRGRRRGGRGTTCLRPQSMSASAPSLPASRTSEGFWAGDIGGIQRSGQVEPPTPPLPTPSSGARSRPSTVAGMVGINQTGLDWARASLRSTAQVRPHVKEPDHFDLMLQYADEQHQKGEESKKEQTKAKLVAFRAGLAGQLIEHRHMREREAEEQRQWSQVVQAKADEFRRDQEQEAEAKFRKKQEYKRHAASDMEQVRRRRQRQAKGRLQESQELEQVMDMERRHREREAQVRQDVHARRAKDAHASFEVAAREREDRQAAEFKESQLMAAQLKRMSETREAVANLQYRERQAIVDGVTATLGAASAEALERRSKAEEERQERHVRDWQARRTAEYWRQVDTEQRRTRDLSSTNRSLASTRREVRGVDGRAEDAEQSRVWRKQDAEHHEATRRKAELSRLRRQEVDDVLAAVHRNAAVHASEIGVTAETKAREVAYHRPLLDRMAVEGFQPDRTMRFAKTSPTAVVLAAAA